MSVEQLIEKALYEINLNKKTSLEEGLDYNIFSLLDAEYDELTTHEYMIYSILNYRFDSVLRKQFIKEFISAMNLPECFIEEEWEVEREHYIKGGRIDLFFHNKGKIDKCIVVELKIDADDQNAQLSRYEEYVLSLNYQDYRIVYITLDKKEPSEQSVSRVVNRDKLVNIGFNKEVLLWLDNCIKLCKEKKIDISYFQQYRLLIKKLVGDLKMENGIKEIVKNSNDLRACIEIANAIPDIKGEILYNFFQEIENALKEKGADLFYIDYDYAKSYYGREALYPTIALKIKDFNVGRKNVTFALEIQVESNMEYLFVFSDEYGEILDSNEVKKKYKSLYTKIEKAINAVLKREVHDNSYLSVVYYNVKNTDNNIFDFKHFSDSCVYLNDKEILKKEARFVAGKAMNYVEQFQDYWL